MRAAALSLVWLGLLGACMESTWGDKLWSLGSHDGSCGEFALSGHHGGFSTAFPGGVLFRMGKDRTEKAWPFIHPGPADTWAGSREHTFTVEFTLRKNPRDACRLMLYVKDAHSGAPPALTVRVNGHDCAPVSLSPGAGDASLTDPEAGKPAAVPVLFDGKWLRRGGNTLSVTTTAGSWFQYDAVTLESGIPSAPQVAGTAAACTPMFKKVGDELRQAVRVTLQNRGLSGPARIAIPGVPGAETEVELSSGANAHYLLVTPFTEAKRLQVEVTAGGRTDSAPLDAKPMRRMTLFAAASTHTDIGYTDLQEKCMELHVNNAMMSMEAGKTLPDIKYNLEVFAQKDWIQELRPDAVPELERHIREGKMGLTGLYLNMLTGLCSGEEMMWLLRPAQVYGRGLGVPVVMASLNDVPSSVGTMPMFLRAAGIRYYAEAVNEDRGPVFMHADPEMVQSPFWWEAPDGSRVLATFTRTYFQISQVRMTTGVEAMEDALPKFLDNFVRPGYPCDAVFLNGGFVDNTVMTPRYAEVAAEWNAKWDFPKVVVATMDEYFRFVEEHNGQDLPVYRGDMGVFWEDGAASSATETGMARWAKVELTTAEKWAALGAARGTAGNLGLEPFAENWQQILYYDEHTWGSAVSISDPNNPQVSGQWMRKAAYADRSLKQGREWSAKGRDALLALAGAKEKADGTSVLVSNPFSWERDVPVTLAAAGEGSSVTDPATGAAVPAQRGPDGALSFTARAVPPMGYRVFSVGNGAGGDAQPLLARDGDDYTWKTAGRRFHICPKTGGFDSITDTASGREWVDKDSGHTLNQYLYVTGGENTAMIHPNARPCADLQTFTHDTAAVTLVENGPARAVLRIQRAGGGVSPVDTDVVIRPDGTFDVVNVIHKEETTAKEAGYFVFPFGLDAAGDTRALMELPYGIVDADAEQMPGACREWYCVNTFAAAANSSGSAYVAAADAPLFCVGDINRGRWPNRLNGNRHILYAYVLNNYWHTNYKASQGGDIRCAFGVRLSGAPFDAAEATRFGWSRVQELTPGRSDAVAVAGNARAAGESFLALDKGPVVLGELLPVGDGVMARLYNPSAEPAETAVRLRGARLGEVLTADLIGDHRTPAPKDGKVTVPARGIATVILATK